MDPKGVHTRSPCSVPSFRAFIFTSWFFLSSLLGSLLTTHTSEQTQHVPVQQTRRYILCKPSWCLHGFETWVTLCCNLDYLSLPVWCCQDSRSNTEGISLPKCFHLCLLSLPLQGPPHITAPAFCRRQPPDSSLWKYFELQSITTNTRASL